MELEVQTALGVRNGGAVKHPRRSEPGRNRSPSSSKTASSNGSSSSASRVDHHAQALSEALRPHIHFNQQMDRSLSADGGARIRAVRKRLTNPRWRMRLESQQQVVCDGHFLYTALSSNDCGMRGPVPPQRRLRFTTRRSGSSGAGFDRRARLTLTPVGKYPRGGRGPTKPIWRSTAHPSRGRAATGWRLPC